MPSAAGGRTENRTDIRRVHDIFQNRHAAGIPADFLHSRKRAAVHRAEHAAREGKACELFQHLRLCCIDWRPCSAQRVLRLRQALRFRQRNETGSYPASSARSMTRGLSARKGLAAVHNSAITAVLKDAHTRRALAPQSFRFFLIL